jgi:hypothetical protein
MSGEPDVVALLAALNYPVQDEDLTAQAGLFLFYGP